MSSIDYETEAEMRDHEHEGICVCAGAVAPLSFTLGYAAPEVAMALVEGEETVITECAMDAWAIGVIAFELLTGKPAFRMAHGKQEVRTASFLHDSVLSLFFQLPPFNSQSATSYLSSTGRAVSKLLIDIRYHM